MSVARCSSHCSCSNRYHCTFYPIRTQNCMTRRSCLFPPPVCLLPCLCGDVERSKFRTWLLTFHSLCTDRPTLQLQYCFKNTDFSFLSSDGEYITHCCAVQDDGVHFPAALLPDTHCPTANNKPDGPRLTQILARLGPVNTQVRSNSVTHCASR